MFFWAAEEIELEGKTIELHASSHLAWKERSGIGRTSVQKTQSKFGETP